MAVPGVELRNITKIFEDPQKRAVVAVDDVSFGVEKGELVTLLGPSGCGKTTILRMIGGFEIQTEGQVFIDSKSVGMLPPNRRNTSMVFQSYALFPHMSLFNNVAYGLKLKKKSKDEIAKKVKEMFRVVGLEGMEDRSAGQISGGQQQRVALARALVNEPSVLLFDEPLSNLDAKLRVQMRDEIRRLQKKLGITSIYVTHDQEEAVCVSDRIVVMNDGIVEQIGSPREIYERPTTRFVAGFFGKVNFVPVKVKQETGTNILVDMLGKEFLIKQPGFRAKGDGRIEAVLRPEAVVIRENGNGIPAKVARAVYMGNSVDYDMVIGEQRILVSVPNPKVTGSVPEGSEVMLDVDPAALHLLTV